MFTLLSQRPNEMKSLIQKGKLWTYWTSLMSLLSLMYLVRSSHPWFCNLSTWGFHPPPVTFCPILVTSCSSFSLGIATGHEQWGQLEKDHSSKSVRWKIWKTGALAIIITPPLLHLPSTPLFQNAASCHSLTDKLTFCRSPCPIQSEFIEGDFDLLHEATAVAMPSVTLIAWWTLGGGGCYGSWSFTDCAAFASIRTTCTEPDGEHARLLWVFISVQEGVQPLGLPEELLSSRRPCCSSTNTVFFSCH